MRLVLRVLVVVVALLASAAPVMAHGPPLSNLGLSAALVNAPECSWCSTEWQPHGKHKRRIYDAAWVQAMIGAANYGDPYDTAAVVLAGCKHHAGHRWSCTGYLYETPTAAHPDTAARCPIRVRVHDGMKWTEATGGEPVWGECRPWSIRAHLHGRIIIGKRYAGTNSQQGR